MLRNQFSIALLQNTSIKKKKYKQVLKFWSTSQVKLQICRLAVIVQSLSCVWLLVTPWPAAHQASSPSPSPRVCSSSCLLIRWRHPTISSSVVPFSFCLLSFHCSNKPEQNQDFFSRLLPFTSLPIWFLGQNGVMTTTLPTQINSWLISAMLQPRRPIWT